MFKQKAFEYVRAAMPNLHIYIIYIYLKQNIILYDFFRINFIRKYFVKKITSKLMWFIKHVGGGVYVWLKLVNRSKDSYHTKVVSLFRVYREGICVSSLWSKYRDILLKNLLHSHLHDVVYAQSTERYRNGAINMGQCWRRNSKATEPKRRKCFKVKKLPVAVIYVSRTSWWSLLFL